MFVPLSVILLILTGCTKKPPAPEAPEVVVVNPVEEDYTDFAYYTGRTVAVEEQQVKARVSGLITRVNFQEGTEVRKGKVLFVIDPSTYEADYQSARAKVKVAEQEYIGYKKVSDDSFDAGSGASEEKKATDKAKADASYATWKVTQANVDRLKLNVDYTEVRAEIDGRISKALVKAGNNVLAGDSAGGGTLLTTIVSIDPIQAEFDVPEAIVLQVQKLMREGKFVLDARRKDDPKFAGASMVGLTATSLLPPLTAALFDPGRSYAVVPVSLGLANEEGKFPHKGYVDFVDNKVNTATGTLRVRALVWNHDLVLSPGLFVRIQVPLAPPRKAVMVPDKAIVTDQDQKAVYLVDGKNEVQYRRVTPSGLYNNLRVIKEGVGPEDRVIVEGLLRARPGIVVKPISPDQAKQ
jgi:RND family efflux transporter MFP subunit